MQAVTPVLTAPAAYRRHRRQFERGNYRWVVAHSPATLAELAASPDDVTWSPGVVVRLGCALARTEQLAAARIELTRGLGTLRHSPARHDLGAGETAGLVLVEVLMTMGAFAEARARGYGLWLPGHHPAIRAAAARAVAACPVAGGDVGGAHAWLDEAAARAAVLGGDLPLALVHADRAVVVAGDGRTVEAVDMAHEAVARLDRLRGRSRPGGIGAAAVVASAGAGALAAADAGDVFSAGALLGEARRHHVLADRPVTTATLDVVGAAVARLGGDPAAAAALLERATPKLAGARAEPARTVAVTEQALAEASLGRSASAVALARAAVGMAQALDIPNLVRRADHTLAAVT